MSDSFSYSEVYVFFCKGLSKLQQHVEITQGNNEDALKKLKQMSKKYEKNKFLLKSAIDQHYSWIKAYKTVIAKSPIQYNEQFQISEYMNSIFDNVPLSMKQNLSLLWATKIIQENAKKKRWNKEFIEEWRKEKKLVQEVEGIGNKIYEEMEKQDPLEETKKQLKQQVKIKSFSCEEKIFKFLHTQKEFKITRSEKEIISAFLSQKVRLFMRSIIKQLVEYTLLNNRKFNSQTCGDQFKYFSKNSPHFQFYENMIIPNTSDFSVSKVTYPSKLQMFNNMQSNEEQYELKLSEEIEGEIGNKRKQAEKRFLKEYLFDKGEKKPVEKKVDRLQLPKTTRLKIEKRSIQYLMERHPYLKDSHIFQMSFYMA